MLSKYDCYNEPERATGIKEGKKYTVVHHKMNYLSAYGFKMEYQHVHEIMCLSNLPNRDLHIFMAVMWFIDNDAVR